jgi:hypothetical protein
MGSEPNLKVLGCIDSGLGSIGRAGREAVYWYLVQKLGLKREGIPDHSNEFLEALRSLFGQGAGILEKTIVRQLRETFNITMGENLEEVFALIKRRDSPRIGSGPSRVGSAQLGLED